MRRSDSPRAYDLSAFLILLAGVTVLLPSCGHRSDDPVSEPDPVVKIEVDGLLYTYHIPTDTEGLFEVEKDPSLLKNLIRERRVEAAWLHLELEKELGVSDLRLLRAQFDETIRRLESLGYL